MADAGGGGDGMGGQLPMWRGLFDWSMRHSDGTLPTAPVDPEKMKWLQDAMTHYTVDIPNKMKGIRGRLEECADVLAPGKDLPLLLGAPPGHDGGASAAPAPPAPPAEGSAAAAPTPEEAERLLDELLEIVENLDFARDYNKMGGLPVLLRLAQATHAGVRGRALEVIGASTQNLLPAQQEVLDAGGLDRAIAALGDADQGVVAKALLCVGSVVRGHPAALVVFRRAGGLQRLHKLTHASDARVRRKAVGLVHHVLQAAGAEDGPLAVELGVHQTLAGLVELTGDDEHDDWGLLRMALEALFALVKVPEVRGAVLGLPGLKGRVEAVHDHIKGLDGEDREAAREEAVLCQLLLRAMERAAQA
ncbi:unnamed protein product [Pedinophyceae sp. YPF-701]|nr:unnamed protein product [Pedinophyceae sp. YPF-701]